MSIGFILSYDNQVDVMIKGINTIVTLTLFYFENKLLQRLLFPNEE